MMSEEEYLVRLVACAAMSEDMAERYLDDLRSGAYSRGPAERLEAARESRRKAIRDYRDHVLRLPDEVNATATRLYEAANKETT
jgi:hypothetical protein